MPTGVYPRRLVPTVDMKICRTCGLNKRSEEFWQHVKRRDGLSADCAACSNRTRNARVTPEMHHRMNLKRYGITPEELEAMTKAQRGLCASCHSAPGQDRHGRQQKLFIDHDHATGKVRSLLCCGCNAALGLLKEDPYKISALLAYAEGLQIKQLRAAR